MRRGSFLVPALAAACLAGLLAASQARAEGDYLIAASVNGAPPQVTDVLLLGPEDEATLYAVDLALERPVEEIAAGREDGAPGDRAGLRWLELAPEPGEYDNLAPELAHRPPGYRAAIRYHVLDLDIAGSRLDLADLAWGRDPGTHYLTPDILFAGQGLPGGFEDSRPLHLAHAGRVVQVVRRAGDDYLGLLAELLNTPFVIPPLPTPGGHQTDLRVGSDCAAFATYGRRRLGEDVRYVGPRGIAQYLDPIGDTWPVAVTRGGRAVFQWRDGTDVAFGPEGVRPGDILHFTVQVSVLFADQGELGVLDEEDLVFHCYATGPHVARLMDTEFAGRPFRLYRWQGDAAD